MDAVTHPREQMNEYACMTPSEYALWSAQVARAAVTSPCYDCPRWFAREAKENGCCNGRPGLGRPAIVSEERRAQWREAAREYRRRRKLAKRNRSYRANLRAQVEAVRAARVA